MAKALIGKGGVKHLIALSLYHFFFINAIQPSLGLISPTTTHVVCMYPASSFPMPMPMALIHDST